MTILTIPTILTKRFCWTKLQICELAAFMNKANKEKDLRVAQSLEIGVFKCLSVEELKG